MLNIASAAAATLLAAGLGLFLARYISAPLADATVVLTGQAAGDYSDGMSAKWTARRDETGLMAAALGQLSENMKNLINEIQTSASRLPRPPSSSPPAPSSRPKHPSGRGLDHKKLIKELAQEVASRAADISRDLAETAQGGKAISVAMVEVGEVSRSVAAEAQTISAATQEQSASSQQIASSSEALAGLATDLLKTVGRFKV